VVLGRTTSHARRSMHATLGRVLGQLGGAPALVFHQFLQAGTEVTSQVLADAAIAAARAALIAGDTLLAQRAVGVALERSGTDERRAPAVLLLRAYIDAANGDVRATKESARVAGLAALRSGDARSATLAVALHSSYGLETSYDPDSLWLIEHVRLGVLDTSTEAAVLQLCNVCHRAMWAGELGDSVEIVFQAVARLDHADDPELVAIGAYNASMALFGTPWIDQREHVLTLLERNSRMYDRPTDRARSHRVRGLLALQTGDVERLTRTIKAAVADAALPGVWYLTLDAARWEAAMLFARGEWAGADAAIGAALERCRGVSVYIDSLHGQQLLSLLDRGADNDEALLASASLQHNPVTSTAMVGLVGIRRAHRGDMDGARVALTSMLDAMDGRCHHRNHMTDLAFVAHLIWLLRDAECAERVLPWFDSYSGQLAVVAAGEYVLGSVDRHRALLLLALGRADEALVCLRAALRLEESLGLTVPALRTRLGIAEALEMQQPRDVAELRDVREAGLRDSLAVGLVHVHAAFSEIRIE
jgi:tetratricopeptide (TPR) repeat protein